MQSIELTFEILANSRNEAAIDVLVMGLDDADSQIRQRSIDALMSRSDPRSVVSTLAHWEKLDPKNVASLQKRKSQLLPTIMSVLRGEKRDTGEASDEGDAQPAEAVRLENAIDAAKSLHLSVALPELILLAESHASRGIRSLATDATLTLATPLGHDARAERDQPTVRGPALARLVDSIRRFSMHRNDSMVEAFLLISTWGDGDLRAIIQENGPTMELVGKCLSQSTQPGVLDLLAGFVRRRNLAPRLMEIIQTRQDVAFRDALLRKIGTEASGTVSRNLRDMGMPKSCHGGDELVSDLDPSLRAALVHLYTAANENTIETMNLITSVVRLGGPGAIGAAAIGLAHCEAPDADFWLRAAVAVADGDQRAIAADENATLLSNLIDLLDHEEPGLVRSVRRVLSALHAETMLKKFHSLRPRSRRRLGKIVMMIDSGAIDRVRDALRHPVLAQRLEAIATADALCVVDLLSDSFTHISREDHQEARMRAADAMAGATGEQTFKLLQEMIDLPESPVRDAAVAAIGRRQASSAR